MSNAMVYGLAASSDTNPSPYKLKRTSTTPLPKPTLITSVAPLKALGAIDFLQVIADGAYPDSSFIQDCANNGVTCGVNNSNDGTSSNWSLSYYQQLASSGVQWVIGESESGAEMCTIMQASPGKLVAGTYGGEGTGGPVSGNNDIWSGNQYTPNCTIGKINFWAETYTSDSMISAQDIGTAAGVNKDAGTFEQGLLIGSWAQNDYGADASTYAEMVDMMISQGVPCVGFQWWYTQGGFEFPSIFTDLMQEYPPNMTPILTRSGNSPVPTPNPTPVAADGSAPAVAVTSDGVRHYFAWGTNDHLWHTTQTQPWQDLGGILSSAPSAAGVGTDVYIFVRGSDKETIWYRTLTQEWTSIDGIATSTPVVTSSAAEPMIALAVRGAQEQCWGRDYNTTTKTWGTWVNYKGILK